MRPADSGSPFGLPPGSYRLSAGWYGKTSGTYIYWYASGTHVRNFTVAAGRDYQAILSGGYFDGIFYKAPSLTIKSIAQ